MLALPSPMALTKFILDTAVRGRPLNMRSLEDHAMRRLVSVVLVSAILLLPWPAFAVRAQAAQSQGASISGKAATASGQPMANGTPRLRNLDTGKLAASTTSSAAGGFSFNGIPAGNYVIELVDAKGQIIGTSAPIAVTPGATITGVTVTASAAATPGAIAGAAAGGIGTATTVAAVAAAAGIAGLVVATTRQTASPSR